MSDTPEEDVASHLVNQGIGTLGTDVFSGPPRAVKAGVGAIGTFVFDATGGPPTDPYLGGDGRESVTSVLQVIHRAASDAYETGRGKVRDIYRALHQTTMVGYWDVRSPQAHPVYLGKDEADRHRWSINVHLRHERN